MKKLYAIAISLFFTHICFSQVVINELDSDTPSTDELEFVELKSNLPYTNLDGYVLVFFNGNASSASTGKKCYYSISLDGITTDANGIALIGNLLVSPVPDKIIPNNTIENGADAVALYTGTISDFPIGMLAHQNNLVDVLFHHTNDAAPTELMELLGTFVQYNETTTTSIQRKQDGTYESKIPTPGQPNDNSGFQYNIVTISTPLTQYNEGDNFNITFTTKTPVTEPLNFTFTLNNSGFNSDDFVANTSVTIPTGSSIAVVNVQLVNDDIDEGDEIIKIKFGELPFGFKKGNNALEIEIIDDDYGTSPYGTPLNPTYGLVPNLAPENYYLSLEGLSGNNLKQALQNIIADPAVVRAHNYGDVFNILKTADRNPQNHNHVWLMYKEQTRSKLLIQTTGSGAGKWNREHIYPQSRGNFADGTSDTADGINIWSITHADSLRHGHADAHHIRAEDNQENTSRNNKDFGLTDYNGYSGNHGSWKGDVARAVFYMAVRYNGLQIVNGNPADSTVGQLGDLATLLSWNQIDPADDFEMNRNNYIYTWQYNRNPFIDHPTLANYIWGANSGQPWYSSLSNDNFVKNKIAIYPNPTNNIFSISGIDSFAEIQIYNIAGQLVRKINTNHFNDINLNLTHGIYFIKVQNDTINFSSKLIIK